MANWIHCNKCSHRYNPNIQFYVRECRHLECQSCSKATGESDGNCSTCGRPCKRVLICPAMKPDVLLYFKPFAQFLGKAKEVYEYQQSQQSNLIKQLSSKYLHAKREVLKAHRMIDVMENDISTLRNGGQLSESKCDNYATSTPIVKDQPLSMLDASLSTVTNNHNYSMATSSPGIYSLKGLLERRPGYAKRMNSAGMMGNQSFSSVITATPSPVHVVPGSKANMAQLHSYYKTRPTLKSPKVGRYIGRQGPA